MQKCPAAGCSGNNGQNRSFTFDGLSRLTKAVNPESGTVNYSYVSPSGTPKLTLQTRSDNRSSNNTTTYYYDSLNRVIGIGYNDGTPNKSFDYDLVGNLGETVAGNVVTTTYFGAGHRPFQSTLQIGSGVTYTTQYAYDLAGNLVSEQYPSGRKLTYNVDEGQRPQTLSGTSAAGTVTPYVQQVLYWPQGSIYVWQYGNNVYPVENYTMNLQPSLNYSTYQNNSNDYQLYLQTNWNNNGTVGGGVECYGANVINTNMSCLSSVYGYDSLNRLTSAGDGSLRYLRRMIHA